MYIYLSELLCFKIMPKQNSALFKMALLPSNCALLLAELGSAHVSFPTHRQDCMGGIVPLDGNKVPVYVSTILTRLEDSF